MTAEVFFNNLNLVISTIGARVWGPTTIAIIVGTGMYLTIRLKFLQLFKFRLALNLIFKEIGFRRKKSAKKDQLEHRNLEGELSYLGTLTTALGCILGTGNIVGVATAVSFGGPGALFWMWVSAFLGMATQYVECYLGVRYRVKDENGVMLGGPMYYIERGFKEIYGRNFKFLAVISAIIILGTTFSDMVHANAIAGSLEDSLGIPSQISAVVIFFITTVVVLGGIQGIAKASLALVPTMLLLYICGCSLLLIMHFNTVLHAIYMIFTGAFTTVAAAGGFLGSTMKMSVRYGMSRGVFSNEAGCGTASFFAAAAKTDEPCEQGFIGVLTTFIDTFIVCTLTGLVIIVAGTWTDGRTHCNVMTQRAFDSMVFPGFGILVSITLTLFAFTSILSCSYFGEQAVQYLFGHQAVNPFRLIYCMSSYVGAIVDLEIVWNLADVLNGLMMAPNLISIVFLSSVVIRGTEDYMARKSLETIGNKINSIFNADEDDDDDDDEDDDE